jgi:hypothetical protein
MVSVRFRAFLVLILLGSFTVSGCNSGTSGTSPNGQAGNGGGAPGAPVANGGGNGGGGPVAPGSPLKIPSIIQVGGEDVSKVIHSIEYGPPLGVDSGTPIVDQCPGKTLCVQVLPKVDPTNQSYDQCTATGNTDPPAGSTLPADQKVIYVFTGSKLPCTGSPGGGGGSPGDGSPAPGGGSGSS